MGLPPGLILDLGCGYGAVAEPLAERGFKYVGFDVDEPAVAQLAERGFDCKSLNIADPKAIEEDLPQYVAGRHVSAVLLLDVLEHLPSTKDVLKSLQALLNSIGQPILIVSLPNVGHLDIGAKLAFGRFDYTPTGLLDETHLSFFTAERMSRELKRFGWVQVGENDFFLSESDQHFPSDHPALTLDAPLGRLIMHLRSQSDDYSHVNQFVRAFAITHAEMGLSPSPDPTPFLSVLVRTQGIRPDNLREALTCLAAQSSIDFDVKILVHTETERLRSGVQALVNEFHPSFVSRVDVLQITGGGQRGRPLNAGLEATNSRYVAFLDDDDLVTAEWVESFKHAADEMPGRVIRSVTVDQQVERPLSPDILAPYIIHTGLHANHAANFDLPWHLYNNQSPICSFAVPKAAIDAFNLRFDETLPVTEDWEFLLRVVTLTGVLDTGRITSVYHRWMGGEGSLGRVEGNVWDGIRTSILHRFDQAPLLLPVNSATRLSKLWATASEVPNLQQQISDLNNRAQDQDRALSLAYDAESNARNEAHMFRSLVEGFERSRVWRATLPIRWILRQARKFTGNDNGRTF